MSREIVSVSHVDTRPGRTESLCLLPPSVGCAWRLLLEVWKGRSSVTGEKPGQLLLSQALGCPVKMAASSRGRPPPNPWRQSSQERRSTFQVREHRAGCLTSPLKIVSPELLKETENKV